MRQNGRKYFWTVKRSEFYGLANLRMCTGEQTGRALNSRCLKITAAVFLAQFSASLDFACFIDWLRVVGAME